MDVSLFTASSPGRIVGSAEQRFFLPDPLPPRWAVPTELWPTVVEANRELAMLAGVGRYLPTPTILLRPLIDREAIQSSRIEGTYATAREYLLFEMTPREPTSESDPANEWKEVYNYRRALELGTATALPLSNRLIRDLHRELLSGVRGRERAPGEFRRVPVAIGTQANPRFVPPPAGDVPDCLNQLELYIHQHPRPYDALVDCFLVHYQFETIHPFMDGNGRVGRLLLILMIQRFCGLSKPWLHMSQFFATHRDEYVERLFNVSANGDWTSWIRFCLEGAIEQCQDTLRRCDKLLQIRESYGQTVQTIRGSKRLTQIVGMVFDSPFISVVDLAKKFNVHYLTAQDDLERLATAEILRELPNHRPRTYYAPEVFNLTYRDLGTPEE